MLTERKKSMNVEKSERNDRRIRYTKAVLRQSLMEMMCERPIEKITVTDLCNKADVNRNTFYNHYSSPSELLSQIQDELFNKIKNSIDEHISVNNSTEMLLTEICQAIGDNIDICKVLLSPNRDKKFIRRVVYLAYDRVLEQWRYEISTPDGVDPALLFYFIANGCIAVIQKWVEDGTPVAPDVLAAFIAKTADKGLMGFSKKRE